MQNNLNKFEEIIGYTFLDKKLLSLSLTHASYANENKIDKCHTNQRLEFLGDAVLELVSSDFLYNNFLDYEEGMLTRIRAMLVCEDSLAEVARRIQAYEYLLIGKGEDSQNLKNNNSTMCDTVESVIAAIYLDGGIDKAKDFIYRLILTDENLQKNNNDYKSKLQILANSKNATLRYQVINEYGLEHDKTFEVVVKLNNEIIGRGIGKSKKESEQCAAKDALSKI